jgi:GTPase SAR1 family protein
MRIVSGLVGAEELQATERTLEDIERRLEDCGGPLHVGLLGGTGVGKSSLINALAGSEVSEASDRRPHTDRIVVYRHGSVQFQEPETDLIIRPHRVHDHDAIRDLVLFDLPDFDSVLPQNRHRVLLFLNQLDVICWLVSPEKYADQVFYDMVRLSPQNPENFVFVLNKIDLFMDDDGVLNEGELEGLLEDFRRKLADAGIEQAKVYAVSAVAARNGEGPAGDFEELREFLYRRRRDKEIRAIKVSNLEYELGNVAEQLSAYPDTSELLDCLDNMIREVEAGFEEMGALLRSLTPPRPEDGVRNGLRGVWLSRSGERGITAGFVKALTTLQRHRRAAATDIAEDFVRLNPDSVVALERKSETLRNRVRAELARFPMSEDKRNVGGESGRLKEHITTLTDELLSSVKEWLESGEPQRVRTRFQRLKARMLLAAPVAVMTLYLMGPDSLTEMLQTPGLAPAVRMVVNLLVSVFQPKGLVALLSLLLIEAILSAYLASGLLAQLDRRVESFYRAVRDRLEEKAGDLVKETKESFVGELESLRASALELEKLQGRGRT